MITDKETLNKIGADIIGSAFDIRNMYGRLMLESFYETVMEIELRQKGYKVERQLPIPIHHKGVIINRAYIADMLINDSIIIEYKAIPGMNGEEFRQLMTYLKLTGIRLGYLINFGAKDFSFGHFENRERTLDHGLYRVIN